MNANIFQKATFAVAAAALTTVSFSSIANAQDRVTRSVAVSYSDLDLTSDTGKARFQSRIRGAVRKVCGSYDLKNLFEARDRRSCMTEAGLSAKKASVTILAAAEAGEPIETAMVISR